MLLTEMMRARALLSYQREAARLLQTIISSIDVVPSPIDGTVRFAFQGDVELFDRLALWGASLEDVEVDDEDADADADLEDDARDLDKAKSDELDEIREAARGELAALNRERGIPVKLTIVAAA